MKGLQRIGRSWLDVILPPQCPISGEVVGERGQIHPDVWSDVHFLDGAVCESCGVPFPYDPGEGAWCTSCLTYPPAYDQARAVMVYDDVSRGMVLSLKHGDRTDGLCTYAVWMARVGADLLRNADVIAPVPLHRSRLWIRRFNQSALLAGALAKEAAVPVVQDLLLRTRATPSQHGKNWKDRRTNVARAFRVNGRWQGHVSRSRVVLVDDVMTTGATVNACAKALKAAGVAHVNILTLARVVRPAHLPI